MPFCFSGPQPKTRRLGEFVAADGGLQQCLHVLAGPAEALNGLAFGSSRMFDNLLIRCNVTRMVTYVTQWHTCTCLRQRHWAEALVEQVRRGARLGEVLGVGSAEGVVRVDVA